MSLQTLWNDIGQDVAGVALSAAVQRLAARRDDLVAELVAEIDADIQLPDVVRSAEPAAVGFAVDWILGKFAISPTSEPAVTHADHEVLSAETGQ